MPVHSLLSRTPAIGDRAMYGRAVFAIVSAGPRVELELIATLSPREPGERLRDGSSRAARDDRRLPRPSIAAADLEWRHELAAWLVLP